MTKNELYEFDDYKPYIAQRARTSPQKGFKTQFAEAAGIQSTYLSQVLHGKADLSLEQAQAASDFLGHTEQESHYFLLLVQKGRAGTQTLRKYFQKQIEQIQKDRLQVSKRLAQETTLGPAEQAVYYSSWLYGAVHMAVGVDGLRTRDEIAHALRSTPEKVEEVLDFLLEKGLILKENGQLISGPARIFLGKSSQNIQRHHTNWRMQAIDSLDRETERDLHYSAIITLSKKDVLVIKDKLLEMIKENLKVIQASAEEELYVFNLDLFDLRK